MSTTVAEQLAARIDADDDVGIYDLVHDNPDIASYLPLSDQYRIEVARSRVETLRLLNQVTRQGSQWKSPDEDLAIVEAWWSAVRAGCTFPSETEQRLEQHVRESRSRVQERVIAIGELSDPPRSLSTDSDDTTSAKEDLQMGSYPLVDLQLAIMRANTDQIHAAAEELQRREVDVPQMYESAVEWARSSIISPTGETSDLSKAAEDAARQIVGIAGPARFQYIHDITRTQMALTTYATFRAALVDGEDSLVARTWSRLKLISPGLLSLSDDVEGSRGVEQHGRTLLDRGN